MSVGHVKIYVVSIDLVGYTIWAIVTLVHPDGNKKEKRIRTTTATPGWSLLLIRRRTQDSSKTRNLVIAVVVVFICLTRSGTIWRQHRVTVQ